MKKQGLLLECRWYVEAKEDYGTIELNDVEDWQAGQRQEDGDG